jgi:hypothetical protein
VIRAVKNVWKAVKSVITAAANALRRRKVIRSKTKKAVTFRLEDRKKEWREAVYLRVSGLIR